MKKIVICFLFCLSIINNISAHHVSRWDHRGRYPTNHSHIDLQVLKMIEILSCQHNHHSYGRRHHCNHLNRRKYKKKHNSHH